MTSWNRSANSRTGRATLESAGDSWAVIACTQVVDYCLLGVLFITPLFFGGRHPLGRLVFVVLACTMGVAWLVGQSLRRQATWQQGGVYLLLIASLLSVTLQLLPLPEAWLQDLVPRNLELLPLWQKATGTDMQLGPWQTLSLAPAQTRMGLATLIAYCLLFVAVSQRLRTTEDVAHVLKLVALSATLMAGFGIVQYMTSNGRFFWFYEYPYTNTSRAAKGGFTCRNHFAHFLVLGTGPLVAFLVAQVRQLGRRPKPQKKQSETTREIIITLGLVGGLLLVIVATLLSLSRGGALTLGVALSVCIAFYAFRKLLTAEYTLGVAALGVAVIGVLSLGDYNQIAGRLDDLSSNSLEQLDHGAGRRKIWSANLESIKSGGWFGAGVGSHREIYPLYYPQAPEREYTHAESGFLQIATEGGFLNAGLLVFAVLIVCRLCLRALRKQSSTQQMLLSGAVSASLMASLVHSVFDFGWFIPACMSLTLILCACIWRLAMEDDSVHPSSLKPIAWKQPRWMALATAATAASVWAVTTMYGPGRAGLAWDGYLRASRITKHESFRRLSDQQLTLDSTDQQKASNRAMIHHLKRVVAQNPQAGRAHLRLAAKYLQQFNLVQFDAGNAMSVNQVREAAIASQFSSAAELKQWLELAFGESHCLLYRAHYHTRRGLALSPLQGKGYLQLANLAFLEGRDYAAIAVLLEQALTVRPHEGDVLFEIGRQELMLGQMEQAVEHWKQAYSSTGNHQLRIARLSAGNLPAAQFVKLFLPTWQTLRQVWVCYRQQGDTEDAHALLHYAAQCATRDTQQLNAEQAGIVWYTLAKMQLEMELPAACLVSIRKAVNANPNSYWARRILGQQLLAAGQYQEAKSHLHWCKGRKPNDKQLQQELLLASRGRKPDTDSKSKLVR